MFQNKIRLGKIFYFKDRIPKYLTSGVVHKFQCVLCNKSSDYGECVRHVNVRIVEHICVSTLTKKQIKPKNNHSPSYDDFSILTRENNNFLPELKESLLIMRDKPSLNRNITLTPL